MLTYFLLGFLAGAALVATIVIGKLIRYRREVLRLKKSLNNTENLNADLQQQWMVQQGEGQFAIGG